MDGCNQIKRIIDEADRPDAIAFEASQHMASCAACGAFADERARLKELIASAGRVSAPADFDIKLKARLLEVKERKSRWWVVPAGYLKLGAATAALVVAVVAAQTSNLFSGSEQLQAPADNMAMNQPSNPPAGGAIIPRPFAGNEDLAPAIGMPATHTPVRYVVRNNRRQARTAAPVRGFIAEDGTTVLMRGPGGELEVPVPTISVGAQSLLYVNSGGRHSARSISTSF
jgi:hypothetical protein